MRKPHQERHQGEMDTLTYVVVLFKGSDTVLVLILIKVRLHISDLDVGFVSTLFGDVHCVAVLYYYHILSTKTVRVEALKRGD